MAAKTAEEVLAASYEKLLQFALTHGGDPDAARIPQLEAERDAALTRVKNLENVRADLEKTQRIVAEERQEHDNKIREAEAQLKQLRQQNEEAGFTIAALEDEAEDAQQQIIAYQADLEMHRTRFTQMQAELDKPRINPEWEDLNRFITAAVEYFDTNPEKAFKNISRAHLALQGKEPTNE